MQRWLNSSHTGGLDGLTIHWDPGHSPHIPEVLAPEMLVWVKQGPAGCGLDRANLDLCRTSLVSLPGFPIVSAQKRTRAHPVCWTIRRTTPDRHKPEVVATESPPNGCTHAPLPCTEPRRSHEAWGRLNAACLTIATEYLSSVAGGMSTPRTSMSSDAHLAGGTHQDNLYLEQPHVNPRYSMREQGLPQPLPAGTCYCGWAVSCSGDPWGAAPTARREPCALPRRSLEGSACAAALLTAPACLWFACPLASLRRVHGPGLSRRTHAPAGRAVQDAAHVGFPR